MIGPVINPGGSSGQLQWNTSGLFGGAAALTYATSGTRLTLTADAAANILAGFVAHATQSANMTEWRNSSGTVLINVGPTGKLLGGTGNLTLQAGSGAGGNKIAFHNDVGTTVLELSRDGGFSVYATIRMGASNAYDLGGWRTGSAPRNVYADTAVRSPVVWGEAINQGSKSAPVVLKVQHTHTDSTPGAGMGTTSRWYAQSSTTADVTQADFVQSWVVATHASRKTRGVWYQYDTAARECLRLEASGSAAMIGFLGASASARVSAYTQTYSTADKTHAAFTSADLTGISSSTTGSALVEPGAAYTQSEMQQNFRRIQDQHNALRADVADVKQLLNSVIDDLQTYGLFQ